MRCHNKHTKVAIAFGLGLIIPCICPDKFVIVVGAITLIIICLSCFRR